MGIPPSLVEQMGAKDFDLLARYWEAEPWGPWRDNMHAALICREIRRPYLKDPTKLTPLIEFMIRPPEEIAQERIEQRQDRVRKMFGFFGAVAKKVRAADLMKMKPRKRRRKVQS
jgi:hypothetical protein